MTTQPNEALVEEVSVALARMHGESLHQFGASNTPPDQYAYMRWRDYAYKARAIIPIVRKAMDAEIERSEVELSATIHAQGKSAAKQEIVEWLRGQSEAGTRDSKYAIERSRLDRDFAAGVVALTRAADAIERGDHHQSQSTSSPMSE